MKKHIDALREALSKDDQYYYTWQANIAMSFHDVITRRKWRYLSRKKLHDAANQAAIEFLDRLIMETKP